MSSGGKREKVSVICTVRDEARTIRSLVASLLGQSRRADEIVFVDGGSSDGTLEILKGYGKRIRVISAPGANIARGRNFAIAAAKGKWIASIDGGCVADIDWLRNLSKLFSRSDVVSGVYGPIANNRFEKLQGRVVCKPIGALGAGFLPSSRSIAFKKSSWAAVGGYPEDTYTAEDTIFDLKLRKAGFKFALARDAIVRWRMRPALASFSKQFRMYGKGDGKTGLIFRLPANLGLVTFSVFSVAALFLGQVLPFCILLCAFVWEAAKVSRSLQDFPELLVLVSVKRLAYVVGVVGGLLGV